MAQNPGLANPEISKIIGEQWRALPNETKKEWKALAEVSKTRSMYNVNDDDSADSVSRKRKLAISNSIRITAISHGDWGGMALPATLRHQRA